MGNHRIPTDLQAVFLASNKGEDVHKPPTSKSAFRMFKTVFTASIQKRIKPRKPIQAPRSSSISIASPFPNTILSDIGAFHEKHNVLEVTSPQAWVQAVLPKRGYMTNRINTVTTAYMNQPTALQLASYDAKTVALSTNARIDQARPLNDVLSCGISLNACNSHGETLMHKACRLGYHHILDVFIDLGAELHICDTQGRTLLHEACWGSRPSFQTFAMLMRHAPELLFMADCRGACPLDYVRKNHYEFWLDFLEDNKEQFWPVAPAKNPCDLSKRATANPDSLPIPNPTNALPCQLALMVATGRMKVDEVRLLASKDNSDSYHDSMSSLDMSNDEDTSEQSTASWCEDGEDLIEELTSFLASIKK